MSPEQAEGRKVDARSDIFSFGSLLYEMVTGRRAFQAETKVSTLSAILSKEPRPAGEIADGIPRELGRILAHCLRKDPTRRFQHLDDVKTLIEQLKDESLSQTRESVRQGEPVRARTRLAATLAVAILLVAAIAAGAWWAGRVRTTSPRLSSGGPPSSNAEANRYFENAMLLVKVSNDVPKGRAMLERALGLDPCAHSLDLKR